MLAALRPIVGIDKVLRFVMGLAEKNQIGADAPVELCRVNGGWGFVYDDPEVGAQPFAFEVDSEDRICGIYTVRNPDKLRHLRRFL